MADPAQPIFTLEQTTALNLELQGTTGSFRVGSHSGQGSTLEVKYFLTHVSLDYENGISAQVLSHLAPVRELFETDQLEFDEIMQRDIDDARVSSELIPYLLDAQSRDMVKLFPPIVVVILPIVPNQNRPASRYPHVIISASPHKSGYDVLRTRSGAVGQEVFEFEQPKLPDGRLVAHDLNRLKLNTERTRLVIVDGQHRAMALLALYRNLRQDWANERRAPYKDFYEEWTPAYIQQFKLKEISLPVMFCAFPEIDETYGGDYDLKQAARSIFLTLNKTARKVSESRNRLLDDNDIVALFLRTTLSAIKKRDSRSQKSLRIFHVELDQSGDRAKIESAIALTGVNHIYYMIEHLLLNKPEDQHGIRARTGRFSMRNDMESCGAFRRLDGRNTLGTIVADATQRNFFSREAGEKLAINYNKQFGSFIEEFFVNFAPFEAHSLASISLEQRLLNQENRKLRPLLFEGQGMSRVFNEHRKVLREKLKSRAFGGEATKVEEIINNLDSTARQIEQAVDWFRRERAANFLQKVSDKSRLRDGNGYFQKVVGFISHLYDNVLSTVAFQTAVMASFFSAIEQTTTIIRDVGGENADVTIEFASYLQAIDSFFIPESSAHFRRMIEVFAGNLDSDFENFRVTRTPFTFREVVYPAEMQPDQWPKYRYLILEIWQPVSATVRDVVARERDLCRAQVFASLEARKREDYLRSESKREEDLDHAERETIMKLAHEAFCTLLKSLGVERANRPTRLQLTALSATDNEAAPTTLLDEAEETWESEEPSGEGG